MRRFENRSALITAAASGLGLGVAQRLAAEGARVVIWDRDAKLLDDALEDAAAGGLDISGRALDMMDKRAIEQAVAEIIGSHGRIDVLVNNIGGSLHVPFRFLEQSDDDWKRVMDINVTMAITATTDTPLNSGELEINSRVHATD